MHASLRVSLLLCTSIGRSLHVSAIAYRVDEILYVCIL